MGGSPGFANSLTGTAASAEILVNSGDTWRYNDLGLNLGTPADGVAWFGHPDFVDSGWSPGPSQLGYGDSDETNTYTVGFGPDSSDKYVTTYFRRKFTVDDASKYEGLVLKLLRDDGAVVYLNGAELQRSNMPTSGQIPLTEKAPMSLRGSLVHDQTMSASALSISAT